jgi:DNA-binding MarR family transcriptional regulator
VVKLKDEITRDEIDVLDKVWHRMIHVLQKTSEELWNDRLEGATTIEISILSIIEHNPDVILKDISGILEIPGSTLTNAIDRLEKRGLIRRTISKRDRRSFGLELTEDGILAQIEHQKNEAILWQKVLGSFDTKEERQELIRLLGKLVANLNS